ncbi:MAG: hypothetical protein DDT26_00751 [Dehalococcoidia bacterium]|nr:hypothetical protein [Chloroflexota bacterium]
MPRGLNLFFNNYQSQNEQTLVEDLIIEAIRMHGVELYYLPRTVLNRDGVFREEELVEFTRAILLEGYVRNVEGFEGEGDFLSKFGLQIRDQITFTLARRTFGEEITALLSEIIRPREGDLVWFPMNRKLFQISFVEHEAVFYQLGSLQTFDIKCELFEYNNETFAVGIPEIDARYQPLSNDIGTARADTIDLDLTDETAQNSEFERIGNAVLDFTSADPFAERNY